jgi:hypothetical protein
MIEGPEASTRLQDAMKTVLRVRHFNIKARIEEHLKRSALNPKRRRPKPKTNHPLPPTRRLVVRRRILSRADQFGIGQPLANNLPHRHHEAVTVVHVVPIVVAERLFIDVSEQVVGFYAHVGPVDSALQ